MIKQILFQKEFVCALPSDLKSFDNVLHVVNLNLIKDSNQKQNIIDKMLKKVEDKGNNIVRRRKFVYIH